MLALWRITLNTHKLVHNVSHTQQQTNTHTHTEDCELYGRTPLRDRYADTLNHPHTLSLSHSHTHSHTNTQLISSGCEFASSQLVLSCLIGWNRDRDGKEAGRGKEEGGRQAGKMSTAECISKIGKTVSKPGNSLHCLMWVHREFPLFLITALEAAGHFACLPPSLFLSDLLFVFVCFSLPQL